MKKKTILLTVLFVVGGLLAFLGYSLISKVKEKNTIARRLQTIPDFELLALDKSRFSNSSLKSNKATIFIYFNTQCDFCQHEALSVSDNLEIFNDVEFLFVSTEPIGTITRFAEQYNLNNKPNITFLHDSTHLFSERFDANSIPYLLIYDDAHQLIKKHKGQLNAQGILNVIATAGINNTLQ